MVDLVLGRGGEADEQGVEPGEDAAVLLVHRAVRLVDDDEVEVAGAEASTVVVDAIDEVHHAGVGRGEDASIGVLLGDEVDGGDAGQVGLERVDGLVDQGGAVGEEQHAFDPVGLHELVDQGDDGAGLARAGRHDEQGGALALVELGADLLDGPHLVVAPGDGGVDRRRVEGVAGAATLDDEFEFVTGGEALHLARRISVGVGPLVAGEGGVVPQFVPVAVGEVDDGAASGLGFEAVGVELGLVLSAFGAGGGAFGLDQRERQAVVAPQDVVDEAVAGGVGHAGNGVFAVVGAVETPAGLGEERVDDEAAGLGLVVVVVVDRGLGLLGGGDLGAEFGDLGVLLGGDLVTFGQGLGVGGVLGGEFAAELDELLARDGAALRGLGRIEQGAGGHCGRVGRVVQRHPDSDVEQLGHDAARGVDGDEFVVDGGVADLADRVELVEDLGRNLTDERPVLEPCELVVGRVAEAQGVVEMLGELFGGAAAVEARGDGVGCEVRLGAVGAVQGGGNGRGKELEVAHRSDPPVRTSRTRGA